MILMIFQEFGELGLVKPLLQLADQCGRRSKFPSLRALPKSRGAGLGKTDTHCVSHPGKNRRAGRKIHGSLAIE
jgi:hypothetical protein